MVSTIALFCMFFFVVDMHSKHYAHAGADSPEAYAGAFFAQVLILCLLITIGGLYRLGFPIRLLAMIGIGTAVLALFFALLPPLTAASSWLTVLLGAVAALVCNALLAVALAALTRFTPLPWDPPRTDATEVTKAPTSPPNNR